MLGLRLLDPRLLCSLQRFLLLKHYTLGVGHCLLWTGNLKMFTCLQTGCLPDYSQSSQVVSTLSLLSPLLRAPLGIPFLHQRVSCSLSKSSISHITNNRLDLVRLSFHCPNWDEIHQNIRRNSASRWQVGLDNCSTERSSSVDRSGTFPKAKTQYCNGRPAMLSEPLHTPLSTRRAWHTGGTPSPQVVVFSPLPASGTSLKSS